MDVSIIIVSYNTREVLQKCIESIKKNTHKVLYEIIVVDNASKDGSAEFIEYTYPDVHVLKNSSNLGFGRANNLGVDIASGDYLFFLNSDTLLISDAISELISYAQNNIKNNIGVVGCRLLSFDGKRPNTSFGYFPSPSSEIRYIISKLVKRPYGIAEGTRPLNVDFVCGADMLICKDLFYSIGKFDENYFLYYEETDLQKRIANAGYSRVILPYASIIHLDGASFGLRGLTYQRFRIAQISYNYYIARHFHGLSYYVMRLFVCVIRLTVLFKRGWSRRERHKAYILVLKGR